MTAGAINAITTGDKAKASASIEMLGREIVARVAQGDKAKTRSEDMYRSAGLQLIEAKSRVPDFKAFLRDHCKGLSRSRAYELIAIAGGKEEEVRSKARERDRRRRWTARQYEEAFAGVRGSRTQAPPKTSETVKTEAKPTATTEAQKALDEFKVAVDFWFARMGEGHRREAVAYASSVQALYATGGVGEKPN
jgi:hypothetical protein